MSGAAQDAASTSTTTTAEGDVDPSTLTASSSQIRPGDEVTFRVECGSSEPPSVDIIWSLRDGPLDLYNGDYYEVPVVAGQTGVYEATVVVPYWLAPGEQPVTAFCYSADDDPEPLILDVLEPEDGPWDVWRPTVRPWLVEPIPDFAHESDQPDAAFDLQVVDGDRAEVAALCAPGIERGGARFIVWSRLSGVESRRHDPFFVVEYPVPADGYADTADGVMITTVIEFQTTNFPDVDNVDDPSITALCTATGTPFEPDAEPFPLPADTLKIDVSAMAVALEG